MATYNSFHAMNPLATGQQTFDAGVAEGIRRSNDYGARPPNSYTREEVAVWRADAFQAAADIARRYQVNPHCVQDILALKDRFEPRYEVKRMLPVCDMTPASLGVAVEVWLTELPDPVPAFYGMRQNVDTDPHPNFYYAGTQLVGVTHWRYRAEQKEKS